MKYLFLAGLGLLVGCVDYPLGDDSSYWQLRQIRREQWQAQSDRWLEGAMEQNKLNQIRMDQERFNNYGFH